MSWYKIIRVISSLRSKLSVLAISKDFLAPANLVKSMDEGTFEKSERNCGRCLKTYGVDDDGRIIILIFYGFFVTITE